MYWNGKDLDIFLQQKEYIDTAIVPLTKLDGSQEGMKQSASATEFLLSLTNFIEQQFKGRIVMLPPMLYSAAMPQQQLIELISEELKKAGFKYIFFLTSDHAWTAYQEQHEIIWLPSIPLESMDQRMKTSVLEDQLRQIIPIFSQKWG
ncbi:MAG: YpiF family protein [Kurthia sp.]|nr:YpiF family protein [Candidatus Kurthia equi]